MALTDILAPVGDGQDFILEMSTGNGAYVPNDITLGNAGGDMLLCEVPLVTQGGGGGNIFIMSE